MEREKLLVKIAQTDEEVREALRLRHEIFHQEHHDRTLPSGLDCDELDEHCQHLLVLDRARGIVAGTYRLNSSRSSNRFYAQGRFNLDAFLRSPGDKLELGRACVRKEYRDGMALHLLWKGIVRYALQIGARFLFGSASVRTQDPILITKIYKYLRDTGKISHEYPITVRAQAAVPGFQKHLSLFDRCHYPVDRSRELLPPLFRAYLRAGAKVAAPPGLDPHMGSADFFTLLPLAELAHPHQRKYGNPAQNSHSTSGSPPAF